MNLTGLETYLAIVESGNLVRASEKLHVSQSTVTTRLQALERHVGARLVARQKSGIELTEAGRRFRHHAETIIELWGQATEDVALPDSIEVVASIGCHVDLWPGPGRALFDAIRKEHPGAALTVLPGDQSEIERLVRSGLIDVALTYEVAVQHNQSIRPLPSENLVLVSDRPNSPMRFDPKYIYVDSGEDFRRRHAAAYSDAGTARLRFGRAEWALEEILRNGGSAYLPERLVEQHVDAGQLHRIPEAPDFTRNAYLIVSERASSWDWLDRVGSSL